MPGASSTAAAALGNAAAATAARKTAFLNTPPGGKQSPPPITRGIYRTLTLVPDAHVAVERVALHRGLPERLDRAHEVVCRGAVRRAGRRDDVLLDHHRAHVVGAEAEGDLADLHALRHPARLDVVDVVEVDPRHGLREQVVERGRHVLGPYLRGEPIAVVLERPGDEGAEAAR